MELLRFTVSQIVGPHNNTQVLDCIPTTVPGNDAAQPVIDVRRDFGDRYAEISAYRVPEPDRYPDGIKYAMQYGNAVGETIVRYDNFPDHPGAARHHKHTSDGDVEALDCNGLQSLFEQFKAEVNAHGHNW